MLLYRFSQQSALKLYFTLPIFATTSIRNSLSILNHVQCWRLIQINIVATLSSTFFWLSRVCHKAGDNCQNKYRGHGYDPSMRLSIRKYSTDSCFHILTAEGQRAGRKNTLVCSAGEQRLRIRSALRITHILDSVFVTCQLNIFTKEIIRNPNQRIEPIKRKN